MQYFFFFWNELLGCVCERSCIFSNPDALTLDPRTYKQTQYPLHSTKGEVIATFPLPLGFCDVCQTTGPIQGLESVENCEISAVNQP